MEVKFCGCGWLQSQRKGWKWLCSCIANSSLGAYEKRIRAADLGVFIVVDIFQFCICMCFWGEWMRMHVFTYVSTQAQAHIHVCTQLCMWRSNVDVRYLPQRSTLLSIAGPLSGAGTLLLNNLTRQLVPFTPPEITNLPPVKMDA